MNIRFSPPQGGIDADKGILSKFFRKKNDTVPEAQTEEGELTLHTLAMFQKTDDIWPFSLRRMFRTPAAQ